MGVAELPVLLMLVGIAAYVVLAGADFGSAFWSLTARGQLGKDIREHSHRSMAPVWEANHVWLIFVLVVCWTAYPEVFGSIFSTLWIPLILACLGIIMRATSYVAGGVTEQRWVILLSAIASFITPFALGTVIGAIVSGRVPVGNAEGDIISGWLNPTSIMIGVLAVTFCAYVAAVYLAGDSRRTGSNDLAEAFRRRGLVAGVIAGGISAAGIAVLHGDARGIYDGLTESPGLVAVLASGVAGIGTMTLLWMRRYEAARFCAAAAVITVIAGWGLAQSPDILPGLEVSEAAADDNVIISLLVSIAVGLLILIPSLLLLYGLVLGGRFDPGSDRNAVTETPVGPMTQLEGPRKRSVSLLLAIAAAGAVLSLVFDSGFLLYAGIVLLLGGLAAGCVMLAVAVVTADSD
jgi:cytochrome d ubiquinol oxidase subunit II